MTLTTLSRRTICGLALALMLAPERSPAAEPSSASPEGILHLTNGGFVAGRFCEPTAPSADSIAWQGTQFTSPFQFPLTGVNAIVYPQAATSEKPAGEFCFELTGGDVLYGKLRNVTASQVEIGDSTLGTVTVRRESLWRFFRWNRGDSQIYAGPADLAAWSKNSDVSRWREGDVSKWREEGGQFLTDQPGTRLVKEFALPPQVEVEIELSWKKQASFVVALGTSAQPEIDAKAFRLEVIDSELVASRETQTAGDIAIVSPLGPGEGHIHLLAYLDQVRGRLLVYSLTGTRLADLTVSEAQPRTRTCFALTNNQGDVCLQRLRISRWNGVPPSGEGSQEPRFQPTDGGLQNGKLIGMDSERQTLAFRRGDEEATLPLSQIDDVHLEEPPTESSPLPPSGLLQLMYQDGTRITGKLVNTDDRRLIVSAASMVSNVTAPFTGLRSLTVLRDKQDGSQALQPQETLELPDTRLRGRLVEGREQPNSSCLTWLPDLSDAASPLRKGVSGRIVYRLPTTPATKPAGTTQAAINRRQANVRLLDVGKLINPTAAKTLPAKVANNSGRYLHLYSGDTIPCDVKAIDERGVTFETPLSDATFVTHDKIKAVELIKTKSTPKLVKQKRDRLLTLPRMQRESPPTQLICSRNRDSSGNVDFLRGRILEMTDEILKVEVRLDVREIPRSRVAQIIWLQDDELKDPAENPPDGAEPVATEATRVQVQRSDGIRLTFVAERFGEGLLLGRSDVLGECRSDLTQIDQLLIGPAIEQAAAKLAYHRWKLHHAIDPKFVQEENSEIAAGMDSPLVGKPAPEFSLSFLDGSKFQLSQCRGEVVVLDFWATWCGPCLQAMPEVSKVVAEFQPAGVRLVAVNLEEAPKQITATLERHKLNVPVVLDQDGIVARKYSASVIPQTVIIDREGNVVRVFVGGGPQLADELRAAIKSAVEPAMQNSDPAEDSPSDAAAVIPGESSP